MADRAHRILIVDDNRITLRLLERFLSFQGYSCRCVNHPHVALQEAPSFAPDLMLLDLIMPDMTGIELCRAIKADACLADKPVMFLTTADETAEKIEAFDAGAVDYVSKPVNFRELGVRIRTHLDLAEAREKLRRYAVEMEALAAERASQLVHADRLASLGIMAAGLAHEIKNPLTFISGNVQSLRRFWPLIAAMVDRVRGGLSGEEERKARFILKEVPNVLEGMMSGVVRIETIVDGLRTFSRKDDTHHVLLDVNAAIDAALVLCTGTLGSQVAIGVSKSSRPVLTLGDAQKIEQVLANLLVNSAHALADTPDPHIWIGSELIGTTVRITVTDNGSGMPVELLDKIWTPFFTTKEPGKGTGLGLSISRSIIEDHRGTIGAELRPEGGMRFEIRLPAYSN
ncbi:MAG: response regulator [Candidatus Schekmanbacteria bacterium]|nr:response regulator [Candidatus Schekmanbacteria bacterium]